MGRLKVVGVIPARLASERLPGKVLLELDGKAMLHHVYDGARQCARLDELLIATDSEPVRAYCLRQNLPLRMTSSEHSSGTERVHEIAGMIPADVYVNIQGDEPLVQEEHLRLLIELFESGGDDEVQVSTLKTPLLTRHAAAAPPGATSFPGAGKGEAANPSVVKVVTDLRGRALYFSRAMIPYRRSPDSALLAYKHLGFYAYRREALQTYSKLPPSLLEQTERLEQLRFLANGIPIHVAETSFDTIGVDTQQDWETFSAVWKRNKAALP